MTIIKLNWICHLQSPIKNNIRRPNKPKFAQLDLYEFSMIAFLIRNNKDDVPQVNLKESIKHLKIVSLMTYKGLPLHYITIFSNTLMSD